ncbi:MAG: DNA helicase PcrA [Clostridiales bacterium]|nr:DNA helicase PcrA [Clostridiales bacterium]
MDLDKLNKEQKEAVLTTEGPLLIFAGAGSGKTRVLTYRIAYLIESSVYPGSILAITFTNKAAGEMKERVENLVGSASRDIWISTFHAACMRILRREIDKIGYNKNFVIFDTGDQKTLIKHCLDDLDIDEKMYPVKTVLGNISKAKNELVTCEMYRKRNSLDFRAKKIGQIYELYQKKLKENNALDFDDIIMKTNEIFEKFPDVLKFYQHKFKYIHVDEYQDTNYAQYKFISYLSMFYRNLCVVGDDDQSIYGFRGADIRNILEFEKEYPDAKIIKLEENYRSSKCILNAANSVIKNNRGRKSKTLWTNKSSGEKISIYMARDEKDEAAFIAKSILKDMDYGRSLKDFAVLYRTNAQSRVIEEAFMQYKIPYRIVGGLKFYDRKEIKDLIAYLRVIDNPVDNISLARIINVPKRNIGDTTLQKLSGYASRMGISMMQAVFEVDNIKEISPRVSSSVKKFASLMQEFLSSYEGRSVPELISLIMDKTGYMQKLLTSGDTQDESRLQNIKEFLSAAQNFERESEDKSLGAFLEGIALISDIDTVKEDESAVVLMTLHSAKGLEFPVVFMAGMEEGIFPNYRSEEDDSEVEEERRLCYVGITRAKEKLYMTYAAIRTLYGNTQCNDVSEFITEIPEKYIEFINKKPLDYIAASKADLTVNKPAKLTLNEMNVLTSDKIKAGTKVRHKLWGEGIIASAIKKPDDYEITVVFDSCGIKKLSAKYAPLEYI